MRNNVNTHQKSAAFKEGVARNEVRIVELLLASGAFTKLMKGIIVDAARDGFVEIVQLLIPHDKEFLHDALLSASENGHEPIVASLLSNGIVPKSNHEFPPISLPGWSPQGQKCPLVEAARGGHFGTVRLLLEAGADIEGVSVGDETALMVAAKRGDLEMVEFLLSIGAKIRAMGGGALNFAARGGHEDVSPNFIFRAVFCFFFFYREFDPSNAPIKITKNPDHPPPPLLRRQHPRQKPPLRHPPRLHILLWPHQMRLHPPPGRRTSKR